MIDSAKADARLAAASRYAGRLLCEPVPVRPSSADLDHVDIDDAVLDVTDPFAPTLRVRGAVHDLGSVGRPTGDRNAGGYGRAARVRPVRAVGDGFVLEGRFFDVVTDLAIGSGGANASLRLPLLRWTAVHGRRRPHAVCFVLFGVRGYRSGVVVGPYRVTLTELRRGDPDDEVMLGVVESLGGGPLHRADVIRDWATFEQCLALGWGNALRSPLVFTLDQDAVVQHVEWRWRDRPRKGRSRGWLSGDLGAAGLSNALRFAERAWPRWPDAEARYGLGEAASYLLRACTTSVIDHTARDLAVALERLVKVSKPKRDEQLMVGLVRLQKDLGLDGAIPERSNRAFKAIRDQLAHEGVLPVQKYRPAGAEPSGGDLIHATEWLTTFVLRHLVAAVGWDGSVADMATLGAPARPVLGRRFSSLKVQLTRF